MSQQRRTITVRRSRNADVNEVLTLEAGLNASEHGTASPEAAHKTLLRFVATSGGRVVGTICVARNPAGIVEVGRLVVDADARCRGVATALIAMAVSQWPARNGMRATIHTSNAASRALFSSAGWVETDEVPWDQDDNHTYSLWALRR